ncbi:MAG TPA: hypothetical protein VKU85_18485 [bacterium]|nr:hypothetical protein [bacterium]
MSRIRSLVVAASLALFCLASPGAALEKSSARYSGDVRDEWVRASTSCQVAYYNLCTGWVWLWEGWEAESRMGVWFTPCCPGGFGTHLLTKTFLFFQKGPPAGYGFTGTLDVWTADAQGCPTGAALRTSAFLPTSSWNEVDLTGNPVDVSGGDFVVTYTLGAPITGDPTAIVTDHPAAGATGPAACGVCFPTTRSSRSYYYGLAGSPLCPGSPFSDVTCDAELLWDVNVLCTTTAVEGRSWGRLKELYR